MPFLQGRYYEDHGQGDAVLLLLGWAGSITDLDRLRGELATGFRVIAADLPGCGRSQPQPRSYTADFYADDARTFLALLDHLGVESAHLVGFSDGGETGLADGGHRAGPRAVDGHLGSRGPGSRAGGRLRPTRAAAGRADRGAAAARRLSGRGLRTGQRPRDGPELGVGLARRSSWPVATSAARGRSDRLPGSADRRRDDPFCPAQVVRELADAIPRGRFFEVPGVGHDVHHAAPGVFLPLVLDWLEEH